MKRAQRAKERAEERLQNSSKANIDETRARVALQRAIARLRAVGRE